MKFLYQLDNIYTTTPWYRPNSKTLCSSIKQIMNLPEKKYFDVYILGGFWCNQSKDTWDVDLFVTLKKQYELSYLKYLKQFMQKCTIIGFQNYILLDLTYSNSYYYLYYTDNYYIQNNNNNQIINNSKIQFNKNTINYFYGKFNKNTLKIINDETILSYSRNIDNVIYKYGCYFMKNGTYSDKIQKYFNNNRIYYKPILIEDYYNTHYYSNNNNILLLIFLFIIYYFSNKT